MMRYFFVGIPSLLFEPIAIVALLGCITTFCIFHKKNNRFFWITSAAICFMFIWRLSLHSLMLSTRYASIILYPAVIVAVLFCFHVREAARFFIRKFPLLKKSLLCRISPAIPYFLISALAVACIAKTLHYDPCKFHTVKVCKALAKEVEGKDFFLYVQDAKLQIAYYSGINEKKINLFVGGRDHAVHESLGKILKNTKNENKHLIFWYLPLYSYFLYFSI